MKNYIAPGNAVQVVLPYATNAGDGVQVGAVLFGVSQNAYSSGGTGIIALEGVFTSLKKSTGDTFAAGDRLFWDNTNKQLTKTSTGNIAVGIAIEAAASGTAAAGEVLLEASTPAGT